ncbi:putative GNAT family acetyltransferase [Mariannaea sp. PMI_226]|nr:putative GNAT family acetyltransferase [Mariannaea sp. PMI_226]
MAVRVRPATVADISGIVEVSTLAFDPSTDAISARLFPAHLRCSDSNAAFSKWSTARTSARLDMQNSVVMVAVDDAAEENVLGFSMWLTPVPEGSQADESPGPKPTFSGIDFEALVELRRIMEQDKQCIFGKDGSKHSWNLDYLGVHPKHQRRGIGKMLLSWGLQQAREQERDCYLLATPAGLPLYEAAGFETIRIVQIFGVPHVSMKLAYQENLVVVNEV